MTGKPIPLAWSAESPGGISAIEVYPAGTLMAHDMPASKYKKREQRAARVAIIEGLRGHLHLPDDVSPMIDNDDCLDAVVCLLAAVDFLEGRAEAPTDLEVARKEGWIWVRDQA